MNFPEIFLETDFALLYLLNSFFIKERLKSSFLTLVPLCFCKKNNIIEDIANAEYQHGFESDIEQEFIPKGLNEDIIRLISGRGVSYIALKDGARGAWCYHGGETVFIPPYPCNSVDPVGAGDGFGAIHGAAAP